MNATLELIQASIFSALAIAAFVQWWRHRATPGAWLVGAFAAIAVFTVSSAVLPEDPSGAILAWLDRAVVAVVFLFPYCLYRFMSSLIAPVLWIRITADLLTAAVIAATFLLPVADERDPAALQAYIALILVQWLFLSARVVFRLWQAGRDEPRVVRRRMRAMAAGAAGLAVGVVAATELPDAAGDVAQAVAFIPATILLIGYTPPHFFRTRWRQQDGDRTHDVQRALMASTTSDEVVATFLPYARQVLGAPAVILETSDGEVVGRDPSDGSIAEHDGPGRSGHTTLVIPVGDYRLEVHATALTPFFGHEEIELLEGLAALAALALNRNELLQERQRLAEEAAYQAERANKAKSEFLSRMSHELRTPLNAILGFGQLLEMEPLPQEQRESLEQMLRGGRRLLDLINEVLDISRIESGTLRLSLEPVPLRAVADDAIALIRPLAAERGIRLRNELPPDLTGEHVFADQQRVGQVLLNLLSNAVKYNVKDGVVSVTAVPTHDTIRIGVTDTGPGIPDDKIPLLFTPFERLGAETEGIEGTGLGLSLSKTLVEAMGGRLEFDTMSGQGTTFWVELRRAESPVEDIAERPAAASNGAKPTLLYIEDNLSNLKLVEKLLSQNTRLSLVSAMTGTLGLDLAQHHVPALILLDLHLPDMKGEEVLIRLRKDPRTKQIPVVILSADATEGQIKRLRESGADGYLTKPIDVKELLTVIDRTIA